jgi:hypothetical protein
LSFRRLKLTKAPPVVKVDLKDRAGKLYSSVKEVLEKWDKKWDVWMVEGGNSEWERLKLCTKLSTLRLEF